MIKKLLLVLLVSLFAVGNVNAQKLKKSMKPKKKECFERPYCGEPSTSPVCDTLNVDTLGAKMFETAEGLKPSFRGNLFKFIASHLQYLPDTVFSANSGGY